MEPPTPKTMPGMMLIVIIARTWKAKAEALVGALLQVT